MFISQPIAPVLLYFFSSQSVVAFFILMNFTWAFTVRYQIVVMPLAYYGVLLVRLKWIACPVCAWIIWKTGYKTNALLALLWPLVILVIGAIPTAKIGIIQKMFMKCLGYEATAANPLYNA